MCELLLHSQANVNAQNQTGDTALHVAAYEHMCTHCRLELALDIERCAHASLSLSLSLSSPSASICSWKQHDLVVALLLRDEWNPKADLSIKNHDGKTAEDLGHSEAVRDAFAKPSANQISFVKDEDSDDE